MTEYMSRGEMWHEREDVTEEKLQRSSLYKLYISVYQSRYNNVRWAVLCCVLAFILAKTLRNDRVYVCVRVSQRGQDIQAEMWPKSHERERERRDRKYIKEMMGRKRHEGGDMTEETWRRRRDVGDVMEETWRRRRDGGDVTEETHVAKEHSWDMSTPDQRRGQMASVVRKRLNAQRGVWVLCKSHILVMRSSPAVTMWSLQRGGSREGNSVRLTAH